MHYSLPPSETFTGAGLYLLYYTGNFPPYTAIAQANSHNLSTQIYAGKAVPSGWRHFISQVIWLSFSVMTLKTAKFAIFLFPAARLAWLILRLCC